MKKFIKLKKKIIHLHQTQLLTKQVIQQEKCFKVDKKAPNNSEDNEILNNFKQQFPSKENRKTLQKKNEQLFQALQNSNTKSTLQQEIQKHRKSQNQIDDQNFNFQIEQSNVFSQNLSQKSDLGIKNQELQEINGVIQNELNESLKIIQKQQIYIKQLQKQNENLIEQLERQNQKEKICRDNQSKDDQSCDTSKLKKQLQKLTNENNYLKEFCEEFNPKKFELLVVQNKDYLQEIKILRDQINQEKEECKQKHNKEKIENDELRQNLIEIEKALQAQIQKDDEKFKNLNHQRNFIDQQKSLLKCIYKTFLKSQRVLYKNNSQNEINQSKIGKSEDSICIMKSYLEGISTNQQQIDNILSDLQQEKQEYLVSIKDLKKDNQMMIQQIQEFQIKEQEYQTDLEAYELEFNELIEQCQKQQQKIEEFQQQNNQQKQDQITLKQKEIENLTQQLMQQSQQHKKTQIDKQKLEKVYQKLKQFFTDDVTIFVIENICQIELEIKQLEDKLIETQFELDEQSLVQSLTSNKMIQSNAQSLDFKQNTFIQQELNQKMIKHKELMHKFNKIKNDFVKKQEKYEQLQSELESLKQLHRQQQQNETICNQSMYSENMGSVNLKRPRSSYQKYQLQRNSVKRYPANNSIKIERFSNTHNTFSCNFKDYNDIKNKLDSLREKYNNIS